jgi:hypothetical protein
LEKYHVNIHYLISKTGAKMFKGIDPKTVEGGDPKTAADDHDAQAGTKRKFKIFPDNPDVWKEYSDKDKGEKSEVSSNCEAAMTKKNKRQEQ